MRVLVAMSGGVDSGVAAALLREQGHEVEGATLRQVVTQASGPDAGMDAIQQARAAAARLGIPHRVLDHRSNFEKAVLRPCWSEYARGRTPNPCVLCNPRFKFAKLFELADSMGLDFVASGHHARIDPGNDGSGPVLLRGRDRDKDQSYFLSRLSSGQLARIRLPVGSMTKPEVRRLARKLGLPNADRPESQDACLATDGEGFAEALRKRFSEPRIPGDVVDTSGACLGRHDGVHRFTVGQRKGLGIALGHRAWVKAIDVHAARVVVTGNEGELHSRKMIVTEMAWNPRFSKISRGFAAVQVRSRHSAARASFERLSGERILVEFDQPQRAITPGQAAVLYDDERVMGCGWIEVPHGTEQNNQERTDADG
jgi:tRNA-specific 2-thiouridylase